MRALPHYYGVELHNFNPNSITQVTIFVAIYEGHLGIAPHWELWLHFFWVGLNTKPVGTAGTQKGLRAGGCTLQVRQDRVQAENRAHAEAYKEQKDTEEARRKRKSLERDELKKHHRQQRHDGLPEEPSPSSSLRDSSSDNDESEAGQGPLDHLPNVRETAPGASASGLASLGGGEDALGLAIACPRAKANMPETQALAKCAVSPMGSTVEVERATAGVTQPPPQRVEGALESSEGWLVPADTGAVPPPPPPPLSRTRDTYLNTRGVTVATKPVGEEAPTPCEAGALESREAKAPSIVEATEGEVEAPRTSEVEVVEARASKASEAEVADTEAPRTTEAEVAEAGAPRTTEAEVAEAGLGAAEPAAQDAEMEAGQASVPPPFQDLPPSQESAREVEVHSISSDDTS
ncbi:uncharacterized protein [Miscanthus floridulus]|uniref:uncharacterized protein n=1 Tax=Miscanthus floridulus TaxID=154761 RepID=UPI003458CCEA